MLKILKQYSEGEYLITEYTRDGQTVSHVVKTPFLDETDGDVIELPKNPLLEAQQNIETIKQQNANIMLQLVKQNNELQKQIKERDQHLADVKIQNSTLMLLLARNGIN
ncbi:hypothetical protein WD019_15135 [Fictibacillus sp. Mic-4]|uniref:hypothetical protein n=1 Tax=Fictibacillus sp. Mic-4 TaxID=3132826 RepID=UPI003CF94BB1